MGISGREVNDQDKEDFLDAAERGDVTILKALLAIGIDINLKNEDGYTALMIATENGHTSAIKVLLDEGADVDIKAQNGDNALKVASNEGHISAVKLLVGSYVNSFKRAHNLPDE